MLKSEQLHMTIRTLRRGKEARGLSEPVEPAELHPDREGAARIVSLLACLGLVALGIVNFKLIHTPGALDDMAVSTVGLGRYARLSFYATFHVFVVLFACALLALHAVRSSVAVFSWLALATVCLVLAVYSIQDVLAVRLPLTLALVLASGLRLPFPANAWATAPVLGLVLVFQACPALLGQSIIALDPHPPVDGESWVYAATTLLAGGLAVWLRNVQDKLVYETAMLAHQRQVMTHLTVFNQRLQEHAKEVGEEAAHKERNRISREMHDSAGYVYTNIMALIEAALSGGGRDWDRAEELLHMASVQARDGLQETRRTLRELRAIEPGMFGSIDSIYRITKIFGEITGIETQVEIGNMQRDYGRYINRTLCRIVQEALTNAVRHGRASKVVIQFWVSHGSLGMIVTDNGIGSKQVVKGIGLAGMEERLDPLGGSIEVSTPEEGGFRLMIHIPLEDRLGVVQEVGHG